MFNLERLSKIKWAESNKELMKFFDVLDDRITDQDVENFFNKKSNNAVNFSNLRSDEIIKDTTSKIIEEFPESENDYLNIPKVIE